MRHAAPILAILLAGCLVPQLAAPPPSLDGPREGWLSLQGNLTQAPGDALATIRMGSFFESWAQGKDYPTFRAPALDRNVIVEGATATLRIDATGPVARTIRFPDVLVYAGSGEAWMGVGNATTPPVLAPGQEYRFEVPLAMPPGGLFVPAGERFGVKVVVVMHQNDAADVELRVGTPAGSRVEWTQRETQALPPLAWMTGRDEAQVAGSAYAGNASTGSERHQTPIRATAAPVLLLAWMNTTAHEGVPDLDLRVISPDGEQLAFSGTPTPREMLRLGPMNLRGPGEYRVEVVSYGSARATASVEWALATASPGSV